MAMFETQHWVNQGRTNPPKLKNGEREGKITTPADGFAAVAATLLSI